MDYKRNFNKKKEEFETKTLGINRVTRVTTGGKQLSFKSVVVVGDRKGRIGVGSGKGKDVAQAIEKGIYQAKKNIIKISIVNDTILHEVFIKKGTSKIFLKPQTKGRGIIAGEVPRVICDLAGIKNISCKILSRSKNKLNNAKAVIEAFKNFQAVH